LHKTQPSANSKNIENKNQPHERQQNMANQTNFEKLHSQNEELATN